MVTKISANNSITTCSGMGRVGIRRRDVQRVKQRECRVPKIFVQNMCYPGYVFVHALDRPSYHFVKSFRHYGGTQGTQTRKHTHHWNVQKTPRSIQQNGDKSVAAKDFYPDPQ